MLVDEVAIELQAGKGGDGKVNFHREKFAPKGGPDGGDGGKGGNVYFMGVSDITALSKFRFKKVFEAGEGEDGGKDRKSGAKGEDLRIEIPVGTVIRDIGTEEVWEVVRPGQEIMIAKGGQGGRGNWHFRSSVNQTPRQFEYGLYGQKRSLFLELRLIADVGLIGLPNTGKSSLLNELTAASVKVAAYPFTTLEPNLGVMENGLIVADLPGLIEGAHEGKGLGIKFLKHIRRTKVLVHCIGADSEDPQKDYETVRRELGEYDKEILAQPEIILITKSDLASAEELKKIKKNLLKSKREILAGSIYDFESLELLKKKLNNLKANYN